MPCDSLPTFQSLAWAALQQYQRAEMWAGIAQERLQLLARQGIRCRELDKKWKEALAFGALVGLSFGAVAGLLFGFMKWGMR